MISQKTNQYVTYIASQFGENIRDADVSFASYPP